MMQNLNQSLSEDLVENNCFITMVLARYRPAQRQLTYANAGHIYPIVWSPGAIARQDPEDPVEPIYLDVRGVPLGILPVWKAAAGELTLPEDGALLLSSDGITEATIQDQANPGTTAMLHQAGLWEILKRQPSPLDLDKLLLAVQGDKDQQDDDQTVLSLEVV
jgi:serine phosphatase RsbU (regulator of sigma subunit)